MMTVGILSKIGLRQLEQSLRRPLTILLHMHESAGKLNQSLVKIPIRSLTIRQPQFLQNIMRLIEQLTIKAVEITQIMCIQFLAAKLFDSRCNVSALLAHAEQTTVLRPKSKV